jgi:hypothetical protein
MENAEDVGILHPEYFIACTQRHYSKNNSL